MSIVSNSISFQSGLDKSVKRVELMFGRRVRRVMQEGMIRMLRRTPVNTGQAAMNYVASKGSPYGGGAKEAGDPVEATNKLALGAESLRPGAEATSMATLATVDFSKPFDTFWITNKSPNISGLEHGELPGAPYTPRSPQGMFGVTLQELINLLESGKI